MATIDEVERCAHKNSCTIRTLKSVVGRVPTSANMAADFIMYAYSRARNRQCHNIATVYSIFSSVSLSTTYSFNDTLYLENIRLPNETDHSLYCT